MHSIQWIMLGVGWECSMRGEQEFAGNVVTVVEGGCWSCLDGQVYTQREGVVKWIFHLSLGTPDPPERHSLFQLADMEISIA